jgi:ppGpp synthetase/RelA/SpoT-type nucleotidyltranferase
MDETLTHEELKHIDSLVQHYRDQYGQYRKFLNALHSQIGDVLDPDNQDPLGQLIHSVKFRLKSPESLSGKLKRKLKDSKKTGEEFGITLDNLFEKITDLAGYRILHLHTRQFEELNRRLLPILEEAHKITEGPCARTWDEETKAYYESIGIETQTNERMYSSVHYLVQPNSRTSRTIEIQVRTLADEIWGEIDHKINYPEKHDLIACREQIFALARVTSSCSRLVDAIMTTHKDWIDKKTE